MVIESIFKGLSDDEQKALYNEIEEKQRIVDTYNNISKPTIKSFAQAKADIYYGHLTFIAINIMNSDLDKLDYKSPFLYSWNIRYATNEETFITLALFLANKNLAETIQNAFLRCDEIFVRKMMDVFIEKFTPKQLARALLECIRFIERKSNLKKEWNVDEVLSKIDLMCAYSDEEILQFEFVKATDLNKSSLVLYVGTDIDYGDYEGDDVRVSFASSIKYFSNAREAFVYVKKTGCYNYVIANVGQEFKFNSD